MIKSMVKCEVLIKCGLSMIKDLLTNDGEIDS